MRLASVRLRHVGVFDDLRLRFTGETPATRAIEAGGSGAPLGGSDGEESVSETLVVRPVTVLFGADGIGKTTILAALAATRPGYALAPVPYPRGAGAAARSSGSGSASGSASATAGRTTAPPGAAADEPATVVTEWLLGEDDAERPHPLVVASPLAVLDGETIETASARRREQALFDRRAQSGAGFVFVGFSGARWFSRAANLLSVPEKSVLRYDVRNAASFDDPTRADLTRDTKQVLAYAAIARALAGQRSEYSYLVELEVAMRKVVDIMLEPFGFAYAGVSPTSFEPEATDASGRVLSFDALPRAARHLVAFGALSLRALFAAYPLAGDPRQREGVVAIDDVESQQDPMMLRGLIPLLRRALPNVQWILTTSSTQLALACAPEEIIALRRSGEQTGKIDVDVGVLH